MRSFSTWSLAAVAVIAFVVFAMCFMGCNAIKGGTVIDKKFSAAHDEEEWVPSGDEMWFLETHHLPDRWFVVIYKKHENGEYQIREFLVTQETYNGAKIGEWMNFE